MIRGPEGGGFETEPSNPEVNLSIEEMNFFKQEGGELAAKSLAVARMLDRPYSNVKIEGRSEGKFRKGATKRDPEKPYGPELGGFEYNTARIMARQFTKAIEGGKEREAIKEGGVQINVLDKGEHKWLSFEDYKERLKQDTSDLKMVAVVADIEGDDPEGATILIRNDMDALQMASGEIRHQCGHNVHSGWGVSNVEAMIDYREKFGELPFKKIVFVSEANEEANPAAGDLVAPRELVESGFRDRYGKIDYALGAHVIASIPEHTARVEVDGFHGAADYVFETRVNEGFDPEKDTDPELLIYEVARLVNEKFEADEPSEKFGRRQIVEDDGTAVSNLYVRLTAMQEQKADGSFENLALNSLTGDATYEGRILEGDLDREALQTALDEQLADWEKLGFHLKNKIDFDDAEKTFRISVATDGPAHVAFGGPNPRQILGEVVHDVRSLGKIGRTKEAEAFRFGGTMRIRMQNHEEVKEQTSDDLREIYEQALENLGLTGKVDTSFEMQNAVAPVINDPDMVDQARSLFQRAGVELSRINLPHAGAESFSEFERMFEPDDEKKMIYVLIGGMRKDRVEQHLRDGDAVELSCVHHSDQFEVEASAIPYGMTLPALAIQYARDYRKNIANAEQE